MKSGSIGVLTDHQNACLVSYKGCVFPYYYHFDLNPSKNRLPTCLPVVLTEGPTLAENASAFFSMAAASKGLYVVPDRGVCVHGCLWMLKWMDG